MGSFEKAFDIIGQTIVCIIAITSFVCIPLAIKNRKVKIYDLTRFSALITPWDELYNEKGRCYLKILYAVFFIGVFIILSFMIAAAIIAE